ncbi:hypothetical protein BMS3Abin04_00940 [bacterium BMS3Abin04]|nr:hypothetical protein BMS3Abin04_00940 [bacterium BMS3Abin04]
MSYFSQDFIEFFSELEKNNNRDWFNSNKKRYEKSVKEPFNDFIQDMIFRVYEDDDTIMISPKEAVFRIYRDLRFSKDKTPYKTYASAVISPGGRKDYTNPGIYLEFGAQYIRFYSGIYEMSKEQIQNVRNLIASDLDEFNILINDKSFKRNFGEIRGEKNKRLPTEFREVVKLQPLIANKQFYYYKEMEPKNILNKDLPDKLMKLYSVVKPLNEFLKYALVNI